MIDKVQKIRKEVERLRNLHQIKYQHLNTNNNLCHVECGKRNLCNDLLSFIDSLQEESVSEDLEEAKVRIASEYMEEVKKECGYKDYSYWNGLEKGFELGAKWQKEQMKEE